MFSPVYIPSKETKKYSTVNQGDLFGNVVRPRGLDFNQKGVLSLAKKPIVLYSETQDANFQAVIAILSDDNTNYVITNDHAFLIDSDGQGATEITSGTPPNFGFQSDGCFFTADLHASGTTSVCSYSLSGGTWTSRITGLSSSFPHPLCVSEHQGYLAVGNGASVKLYDSAYSLVTTLTLPSVQVVTWIRWRANLLYIGCRNINGGEAKMYIWNGSGTAAQAGYGVGCEWVMSGCEYGSGIVVVVADGRMLQFAGDGFIPLRTTDGIEATFPVYYSGFSWGDSASTSNLVSKVASRGMVAKGRRIYMVVDSQITSSNNDYLDDFPSGLWVFDPEVGLYHKAGFDHKQRTVLQPSAVSSDTLTLPSAVVYETGDPVFTDLISGLTGDIHANQTYYAIKVDSTHIKLANTPQEAIAGVNITITGTPGVSDKLAFNVYQAVGATRIQRSGGVNVITRLAMPNFYGSEVLFGGEVDTSLGATVGVCMSLGMGKNVGSFQTPTVQASAVTDLFKKIVAKFPPLNIPSRKILVKYRIAKRWGMPGRGDFFGGNATWVNSTSFTINPKTYDFYSAAIGDEVEFTAGAAAGYTAHISNIVHDSSTQWTITIDEAMPDVTASDVSDLIVNNWVKYKTISTTADVKAAAKGFKNMALTKNAKWVQLKIELRGYTDVNETMDIEELAVVNGPDQKYA